MLQIHWNITLLAMASENVAQEIQHLHPMEQLSQRAFSSTAHIIRDEDVRPLADSLAQQGYTVRVEAP